MNSRSIQSVLLLFLFSMLITVSCKKDMKNEETNPTPGTPFAIPAATPVTGSVSGIVVDENNAPVNGAEIKLGIVTATTNAQGLFDFNNVTLDKYISTVTVTSTGYFKAYRSFSANASRNYLNIKLIPRGTPGTINSTSGGAVTLSNGTALTFQANSVVVKSTGAPYTGPVKIYSSYIDPTASDISSIVPGSFMGTDGTNLYTLQSTGMIAVDMESDAGEPLQLASGLPATIKLPIPSSLTANAPATIDTWSLNEQGVWTKEATATKSGNFYEMQVTHFSFWNCDVPANAVYLTLHVVDQNGNPLINTLVELTIPNNNTWWATTYGYTDGLGNVSGLVPAGIALEMNVYPDPYSCSAPAATQTIGPYTTNAAQTVTVTVSAAQTLTISGTATDCSSNPLQDGTAIISTSQNTFIYSPIVNGSYTATLTYCTAISSIEVTAIDNTSGAQGTSGSVAVSGNTVTVPDVNACGGSGAAVFTFGNGQGNCSVGTSSGTYQVGQPADNNIISIMVNVTAPGSYSITTTTTNGITFAASGVFTNTGQQFVYLNASGIPLNTGIYTFITQSLGMTGCYFVVNVGNVVPPQAVIELGSPATACPNINVNGSYVAGVQLISSNTITLTLNVTSAGTYHIFTDNINGVVFADSGTVTATGMLTFVLTAENLNNLPLNSGVYTYTLQSSTGAVGCTFPITFDSGSVLASFTFDGAPGTCTSATQNGPFVAGTALTGQSTITIAVTVAVPGSWAITCNPADGINLTGQGVFTTPGIQFVTLTASGTPISSGTYTFIPSATNTTGCVFTVVVN